MKIRLLCCLVLPILFSCQSRSPKETAHNFVAALYISDINTASSLTSNETRSLLEKAKKATKNGAAAEESFNLATLTETVNGDKAEVKNELIEIPLVKEPDGWKVALNEDLLTQVTNRDENMTALKGKWDVLQKAYEERTQTVKQYVDYKKGSGTLTEKTAMLNQLLVSAAPPRELTRQTILAYVEKQQAMAEKLDEALEPSQAANADLSLNYFLQISNAGDRVKAAEADYQQLATKSRSPLYPPLPLKGGKESKL